MKIQHVGVITNDIHAAISRHEAMFDIHPITKIVEDHVQKVAVVLLSNREGDSPSIELISPLSDDSPVINNLKKKMCLYHVCFSVDNIEIAIENARRHGAQVILRPTPAKLFRERKIAFIYTPDHYIVEFLETKCPSKNEFDDKKCAKRDEER